MITSVKRKYGEDPLKQLDARTLAGKFRSKKDLYSYLDLHCKRTVQFMMHLLVQMYLPPLERVNKDFMKQVLAEKKQLLPKAEVRFIRVPDFDELSVKNLWS